MRTGGDYDSAVASGATEDSPELAVCDLKMPGKSGLELVKALHEIDPLTKTVVLTGYGSIATAIDAGPPRRDVLPEQAGGRRRHHRRVRARRRAAARARAGPANEYRAPSLARAEWEHINRVLSDAGGNISEAARRLGIHRRSLQRKLAESTLPISEKSSLQAIPPGSRPESPDSPHSPAEWPSKGSPGGPS